MSDFAREAGQSVCSEKFRLSAEQVAALPRKLSEAFVQLSYAGMARGGEQGDAILNVASEISNYALIFENAKYVEVGK